MKTRPLPVELRRPGIIGGGGLNKSVARNALQYNELWTCNNIEPTTLGISNRNIGVTKQNTTRLNTAPIRGMFVSGSNLYFACNGHLQSMPLSGGSQSTVNSSVFNASKTLSIASGLSTSGGVRTAEDIICDGSNNPYGWNGSSLSAITAFSSDILTEIKTSNKPDKVINYQERSVFGFPDGGVNKNYVLASDLLSSRTFTSGAGDDNAWFEIVEGGKGYITALNSIKRAGSEKDNEILVVHKANQSFNGIYSSSAGNNRFGVFTSFASGLGAVNQQCTLSFNNDIFTLTNQGIGSLSSASDDISSVVLEAGIKVNSLIQESGLNVDFNKSFAFHCPERQLIYFTMPLASSTSAISQAITYPETPMNLSICYKYALQTQTGQITDFWSTRSQDGWGWSSVFINGKDIYLGSYFGDIYKLYEGDEYERNPSTPTTHQPITSTAEWGDWDLETGYTQYKEIADLTLNYYVYNGFVGDYYAYWDEADYGVSSLQKDVGSIIGASQWGIAKWGISKWAGSQNAEVNITPPDGGRTIRLKQQFMSERLVNGNYISNHAIFNGLSGNIIDGTRLLRFK